jgi:NodT family efflux transporter outer membrane factor (OMF) lipoprotein
MRSPAILLAVVLTACAGAPAYRPPPVPVPAQFREPADPRADSLASPHAVPPAETAPAESAAAAPTVSVQADSEAWRALGDSTLDRLIGELARANLDVRGAEARVRGARAARTETSLDLAPTVTFGGGYTRQRLAGATFPIGSGTFPDQDIWDAGFDATWELDLFGRFRRNLQAQGAFVAVAQEDLRDLRVSLTAELARAYFELRGAQERLAVAQRNAENQQRTYRLTKDRLDAGRGTAFDTERAQAQLAFTLASIPALQAGVSEAQYRIGVLVGRPPAVVAAELGPAPLPPRPATTAIAGADASIRRRPDVASAERRVAAERALVSAAKADYLPRLSVGGSAGFTASRFDSLTERGTFRYAVGPVITWPALNLGRVKARVDQSRARAAEAEAFYGQTVLLAQQEVETALARYRTARERVAQVQNAASASERAAELARLRFTGGVADFLQVLDAERTQLDAEDQLARGRTDAATAYAALYKALGGAAPVSD